MSRKLQVTETCVPHDFLIKSVVGTDRSAQTPPNGEEAALWNGYRWWAHSQAGHFYVKLKFSNQTRQRIAHGFLGKINERWNRNRPIHSVLRPQYSLPVCTWNETIRVNLDTRRDIANTSAKIRSSYGKLTGRTFMNESPCQSEYRTRHFGYATLIVKPLSGGRLLLESVSDSSTHDSGETCIGWIRRTKVVNIVLSFALAFLLGHHHPLILFPILPIVIYNYCIRS